MLNITLKSAILALLVISGAVSSFASSDNNSVEKSEIKNDYVKNCQSGHCAPGEAAAWSDLPENHHAVAIAVAIGTAKQIPDYEIKEYLTDVFTKLGIRRVKFFFEHNDIENTGLTYHVRGGTTGPFALNRKVIDAAREIAEYAKDDNPLFRKQ